MCDPGRGVRGREGHTLPAQRTEPRERSLAQDKKRRGSQSCRRRPAPCAVCPAGGGRKRQKTSGVASTATQGVVHARGVTGAASVLAVAPRLGGRLNLTCVAPMATCRWRRSGRQWLQSVHTGGRREGVTNGRPRRGRAHRPPTQLPPLQPLPPPWSPSLCHCSRCYHRRCHRRRRRRRRSTTTDQPNAGPLGANTGVHGVAMRRRLPTHQHGMATAIPAEMGKGCALPRHKAAPARRRAKRDRHGHGQAGGGGGGRGNQGGSGGRPMAVATQRRYAAMAEANKGT